MTIPDEMVNTLWLRRWEMETKDGIRAALEAVAPALIAQGLREAAQLACLDCGAYQTIEARAQELDPK